MTLKYRLIRDFAVLALLFQLIHLIEHAAQLGYWFANPSHRPWLTPWAEAGRDALAVDGMAGTGNEILHLIGNLIFFAGLLALAALAQHAGSNQGDIGYRGQALYVQGFHVGEHVLLTGSYLIWGTPLGFTTLFGAASGPFGSTLRVWAHFTLNMVATYYAGRAVLAIRWQRSIVSRSRVRARSAPDR